MRQCVAPDFINTRTIIALILPAIMHLTSTSKIPILSILFHRAHFAKDESSHRYLVPQTELLFCFSFHLLRTKFLLLTFPLFSCIIITHHKIESCKWYCCLSQLNAKNTCKLSLRWETVAGVMRQRHISQHERTIRCCGPSRKARMSNTKSLETLLIRNKRKYFLNKEYRKSKVKSMCKTFVPLELISSFRSIFFFWHQKVC